ncbi:bacillithiol biosynthesis deacetylase BshB2 [Bacillus sp. V59.32b]|uniref:bacillithiol biosynthesis deacetylase BshB2 n=1 Tax=Bacillus sp. V59.32b TaxID=1758642 RepID=UPI000E3BF4F4|nr:bacillithiol biosynthesis deacetylase BshB2 [Bacillus sp. V59.32b]RFU67959.1 bacillithiol biosynthesis deacetylase BshB2 [Bacillus sp. V59.32b]
MEKERHVLVIFPHPDDEAFGVSGTIALNIESGTPVTYVCLTLGEMGRNLGNPPFATRESLPKIRRKELVDAANTLGIQDLRMLGLRDKTVEFEDDEELTEKMSAFIKELDPSLVITFYPGYSVHPDHEATARAVVRAVKRIEPDARPKLHCVAFANNSLAELGEPDIINDVTAVEDKKIAAIKAHRSQTESMIASWAENTENVDPAMLEWIRKERFWTYKFSD